MLTSKTLVTKVTFAASDALKEGISRQRKGSLKELGLLYENERFLQGIIARHLLLKCGYHVGAEKEDRTDLVIYQNSRHSKIKALCEIKKWMSDEGVREMPGIRKDINKLKDKTSNKFVMIVVAYHPKFWTWEQHKELFYRLIGAKFRGLHIIAAPPFRTDDSTEWVVFSVLV